MVAEMADEIKYIAETLAEELPRSDAFQEIREMIKYVGGLTDELKFIRKNMRRHIPELIDLYRFQHRPATGFCSAWFGAAEVWGSVCNCVSYGHLFRGTR